MSIVGEDLKVNCALDVKPGLQAPNVKFFRGKRELKDDTRTRIIHKDQGSSLNINKARFSDESKYTVIVEQEGVPVDQATFSVFVKGLFFGGISVALRYKKQYESNYGSM